jgi:hypothetical protein
VVCDRVLTSLFVLALGKEVPADGALPADAARRSLWVDVVDEATGARLVAPDRVPLHDGPGRRDDAPGHEKLTEKSSSHSFGE